MSKPLTVLSIKFISSKHVFVYRFSVEILFIFINHEKTDAHTYPKYKMPLIIMTGYPSSGKTKRSKELADFFRERGKTVHIVSENSAIPKAGFTKNEYFADSQKEKVVRSHLKSETVRLLTKDNVVILDGGNYIKGKQFNSISK